MDIDICNKTQVMDVEICNYFIKLLLRPQ